MSNFLTRVEIQDGQLNDYETLHREMTARRFHRHIVAADNTPYLLLSATYFSLGTLSAIEVRNLADAAAEVTGKQRTILTLEVAAGQIAWKLDRLVTPLPPIEVQPAANFSAQEPGGDLLEKIQQTMDKVTPLAETTAKVSSDFGQALIKGCTTLNAGALIALPAFYKALAAGSTSTPRNLYIACGFFAGGLIAGVFAGWAAFVFTSQVTRMLVRSLQMPMLKAQQTMYPKTMDKAQLKRLSKAEMGLRWGEPISAIGLWVVSIASAASVVCLVLGAYYGGTATLSVAAH